MRRGTWSSLSAAKRKLVPPSPFLINVTGDGTIQSINLNRKRSGFASFRGWNHSMFVHMQVAWLRPPTMGLQKHLSFPESRGAGFVYRMEEQHCIESEFVLFQWVPSHRETWVFWKRIWPYACPRAKCSFCSNECERDCLLILSKYGRHISRVCTLSSFRCQVSYFLRSPFLSFANDLGQSSRTHNAIVTKVCLPSSWSWEAWHAVPSWSLWTRLVPID